MTAEERDSPLHVTPITPMDVDGLRGRMSASRARRFDEVWKRTFYPDLDGCGSGDWASGRSAFQAAHARLLVQCGVAQRATGPGFMETVPFTVLEEKESGMRQRFILWTKQANERLDRDGYVADVPIGHISEYLDAVHEPVSSLRDFRTGFFAIEVPADARWLFRFQADDGSWYELSRLPMGHCCAPELMHSLAGVMAGDPAYVREELVVRGVMTHVWIDNIRFSGEEGAVRRETALLDARAFEFGVTWKDSDSETAARVYDFLGVRFDHTLGTVAVASRLRQKLWGVDFGSCTAGEVESTLGRLLHSSAIAGVSPGQFWFALKYARRVTNNMNRGILHPHDAVSVPPSVRASLSSWRRAVMVSRALCRVVSGTPSATVFVDASLDGWGGVVVNDATAEIAIVGGAWKGQARGLHINQLEALAFKNTMASVPSSFSSFSFSVFIDNTTVLGVARRRSCIKNRIINDAVVQALETLRSLKASFSLAYVKSADNPADLPSRVSKAELSTPSHFREVSLAVGRFLNNS